MGQVAGSPQQILATHRRRLFLRLDTKWRVTWPTETGEECRKFEEDSLETTYSSLFWETIKHSDQWDSTWKGVFSLKHPMGAIRER